jgi:hypothetical protein
VLRRISRPSDEVRVPEVPRGSAVIVTRYREEVAKVAVVNPDDLAMLERSHDLLEGLEQRRPAVKLSEAELEALEMEDRPRRAACVEDAEQISAILRL